ncbi:unnamed protein product [marine sediment metagenome]|uniref:Uncharacterized protein n=1 Tax=marine sediment metagenome TaxID=412755 RepID=X1GEZ7_9ZZZZ
MDGRLLQQAIELNVFYLFLGVPAITYLIVKGIKLFKNIKKMEKLKK